MRKHVIVEGPDGSGKDTLIQALMAYQGWEDQPPVLHERASTSLGGPVPELSMWVGKDLVAMPDLPPSIYNRHPVISEPIYGQYRTVNRRTQTEDRLWSSTVWVDAMQRAVSQHAILVRCLPPLSVVMATVASQGLEAHMPGVAENLPHIYGQYRTIKWPGLAVIYDYTSPNHSIPRLITTINRLRRQY